MDFLRAILKAAAPARLNRQNAEASTSTATDTNTGEPSTTQSRTPPNSDPPPPLSTTSTPVAAKLSNVNAYSTHQHKAGGRKAKLSGEMVDKFVGPMPIDRFFDVYVKDKTKPRFIWNTSRKEKFKEAANKKSEKEMYPVLMEALQPYCGSFELVDTSATPDVSEGPTGQEMLKPDLTLYRANDGRGTTKTDLSKAELTFELKNNTAADDPFCDDLSQNFVSLSTSSRKAAGQLTAYAVCQFATQFRTHLFSIMILKTHARIIYWDRSGAVVTEKFPLAKGYLARFVWAFTMMSDEERGIDTTVTTPTAVEIAEARLNLDVDTGEYTPDREFVKFLVHDEDKPEAGMREFIGKRPVFKRNSSLVGRASRGFVVWDPVNEAVMYLKDTWRLDLPSIEKEGKIYRELHDAGVKNIAPFVCAGDLGHKTRVQDEIISDWARWGKKKAMYRHSHYRLVLGVVGRDLTSFRSTKELVTAVHDAIVAHDQVLEKAEIMHRDISAGNILILDTGRGILIDFDLCKRLEDMKKEARATERSGTWQFMSARLQHSTEALHPERADDLESFLHVLTWIALRYVPNGLTPRGLAYHLTGVFDYNTDEDGVATGRDRKTNFLKSRTISECGFEDAPLSWLMDTLTDICASRYEYLRETLHGRKVQRFAAAEEDRKLLQTSTWFIERFKEALEMPNWPENDKAVMNPVELKLIGNEDGRTVYTANTQIQSTVYSSRGLVQSSKIHGDDTLPVIEDSEDKMDIDPPAPEAAPRVIAPLPPPRERRGATKCNGTKRRDWIADTFHEMVSRKRGRDNFEDAMPAGPPVKIQRTAPGEPMNWTFPSFFPRR